MRYILVRFMNADTHWAPAFALKRYDGSLVLAADGSIKLFGHHQAVFDWVRIWDAQASIEWEGSTY